jgi:hypothetical protein
MQNPSSDQRALILVLPTVVLASVMLLAVIVLVVGAT